MYYLSKQISFWISFWTQPFLIFYVLLANYDPIYIKIDIKAGYDFGAWRPHDLVL